MFCYAWLLLNSVSKNAIERICHSRNDQEALDKSLEKNDKIYSLIYFKIYFILFNILYFILILYFYISLIVIIMLIIVMNFHNHRFIIMHFLSFRKVSYTTRLCNVRLQLIIVSWCMLVARFF